MNINTNIFNRQEGLPTVWVLLRGREGRMEKSLLDSVTWSSNVPTNQNQCLFASWTFLWSLHNFSGHVTCLPISASRPPHPATTTTTVIQATAYPEVRTDFDQ